MTKDSFSNLCVNETSVDNAPKTTLKQIPCIREDNVIYPTFAKELGLRIRSIA